MINCARCGTETYEELVAGKRMKNCKPCRGLHNNNNKRKPVLKCEKLPANNSFYKQEIINIVNKEDEQEQEDEQEDELLEEQEQEQEQEDELLEEQEQEQDNKEKTIKELLNQIINKLDTAEKEEKYEKNSQMLFIAF